MKLLKFFMNVLVSFICWTMALMACARVGKFSRKVYKAARGITENYRQDFWDYMDDKITREEHDKKLNMYYCEI